MGGWPNGSLVSQYNPGLERKGPGDPFRTRRCRMRQTFAFRRIFALLVCFAGFAWRSSAQLPPVKNPLAPVQNAASAGCSTTDASSCAQVAAKLLPIIMGPSPMEENLRRLTDEIGGRVTGSPEMAKAVEWAVAAFRAAGVDVHTEKYTLPVTWAEGKTEIRMELPWTYTGDRRLQTKTLRAVSEAWGLATPEPVVRGQVVDVGSGAEEEFRSAAERIPDAILLVHSEISSSWTDLFNEYLRPPGIIDRAVKGGAKAILWMGARERLLLYRHTNSLNGEIGKIPQAIVAR